MVFKFIFVNCSKIRLKVGYNQLTFINTNMRKCTQCILLFLQLSLFLLGRLLDDLSWQDVHLDQEVQIFQGIALTAMFFSLVLKFIRKWQIQGIFKILLWQSQLKFVIPWSLTILIVLLFFSIFGCTHQASQDYFFVAYAGCCLNATQLVLTNLNYSMICNTKAHRLQLVVYETVLFTQIIYNGFLLLNFVDHMEGKPKDYSILFISIIIANLILIMDLLFRAAHQEREREEKDDQRYRAHMMTTSGNIPEASSNNDINSPVKRLR